MNAVALSDVHGALDLIDPGDAEVCIIAGDILAFRTMSPEEIAYQRHAFLNDFISRIEEFPETQFVFVAGNHDFALLPGIMDDDWDGWPKNAHFLRDSGCEIGGKKFWGTSWVPEINGSWAFEASRYKQNQMFGMIPSGIDVLISHTPPYLDKSINIDVSLQEIYDRKPRHFGSVEMTKAIDKVKPEYFFCGHIHSGDHSCFEVGDTKCFNVSVLDERYQPAYGKWIGEI